MIIKCCRNGGEIEFSERRGLLQAAGSEYFRVTIRTQNMRANTKVYSFDPFNNNLTCFFGELATNWKGFDGEKIWESLEGEFKIICTSDNLGHFALESIIRNGLDMCCINTIYAESGQLENIAEEIRKFFDLSV